MDRQRKDHYLSKLHNLLSMGIPNDMDMDTDPDTTFAERHRIDCDGKGVSTLVLMDACHMNCKYCPNKSFIQVQAPYFDDNRSCRRFRDMHRRIYDFEEDRIFEEVQIDELYYSMTGGGVVFGGGEPLLFIDSIKRFKKLCPYWWDLRVETSLNVKTHDVEAGIKIFNQWIVDVKTLNNKIYKAYTGFSNSNLHNNLRLLASKGIQEKVIIRLPLIPGYNDENDIEKSRSKLKSLGFENFDIFEYQEEPSTVVDNADAKCEYLRNLRQQAAEIAGIEYNPAQCEKSHTGEANYCNGHCAGCDHELNMLTKIYVERVHK